MGARLSNVQTFHRAKLESHAKISLVVYPCMHTHVCARTCAHTHTHTHTHTNTVKHTQPYTQSNMHTHTPHTHKIHTHKHTHIHTHTHTYTCTTQTHTHTISLAFFSCFFFLFKLWQGSTNCTHSIQPSWNYMERTRHSINISITKTMKVHVFLLCFQSKPEHVW